MQREVKDLAELYELAADGEGSDELTQLEMDVKALERRCEQIELQGLLSGPQDMRNCFFSIHAGAGGTESCDWASMLLRMYTRYFDTNKVQIRGAGHHAGRRGRHPLDHVAGDRAVRVRQALVRDGRAPAGADQSVRRQCPPAHELRGRRRAAGAARDRFDAEGERSARSSSSGVPPGPAGRTSTRSPPPSASGTSRPGSSSSASTSAARRRTSAWAWPSCKRRSSGWSRRNATRRWTSSTATRAKSPGATRSAATCSSRTSWSRITAPDYETGNVDAVLDGELEPFIESYLHHRVKNRTTKE